MAGNGNMSPENIAYSVEIVSWFQMLPKKNPRKKANQAAGTIAIIDYTFDKVLESSSPHTVLYHYSLDNSFVRCLAICYAREGFLHPELQQNDSLDYFQYHAKDQFDSTCLQAFRSNFVCCALRYLLLVAQEKTCSCM